MVISRPDAACLCNKSGQYDKLEASLRIAQAEKDRLERLLFKARQESENQKKQNGRGVGTHADVGYQQRTAEARARRAAKDVVIIDSESVSSGIACAKVGDLRRRRLPNPFG